MSAFGAATAVHADAAGHWRASVEPDWAAPTGPNGGFLAAVILRALTEAVDDPARTPRTMTLHFVRPPAFAPAEVIATVERAGRSLTTLSVRLEQDGRLCVLGLAAFASAQPPVLDYAHPMPQVPAFDTLKPLRRPDEAPPIFHRLTTRPCLGPRVFSGADEALTGGWLGLAEPEPVDPPQLALLLDAWLPAPFTRLKTFAPAPTVEMTFHFRTSLDRLAEPVPSILLGRFSSRHSAEGFEEEDGELWSPGGVLLAQSRQLALMRAPSS